VCFAEAARERAAQADVVVVNAHLYVTSLAIGGELLPDHDLVVFDEAHELEDIASAAFGFEIGAGRLQALARNSRPLLDDVGAAVVVEDAAVVLMDVLKAHRGSSLPRSLPDDTQTRLALIRERVARLASEIRQSARAARGAGDAAEVEAGLRARHLRSQQAAGHLVRDLDIVLDLPESQVAWVEGPDHAPVLRVAPLDVGAAFHEKLWGRPEGPTAVLTSATIPTRLGERLGLPAGSYDQLDVGSPYEYHEQALLYCPLHLPDPRHADYEKAMHDELVAVIEAAGGRTLALFTSWRAMQAAADAVRDRISWPLLTQLDLPKPALVARFSTDEHSCLFATMGFWQGVDVPGSALSVVTIDRLPFPRPDDPLLQARRAQLGRAAFDQIDVPRAATLLAQGTGRLIRSRLDRGVVAVFDTRLGRARYRWALVNALPPMRRTRHRADVEEFLAPLRAG
jgi:ATP-dependent DNA helicase DinG